MMLAMVSLAWAAKPATKKAPVKKAAAKSTAKKGGKKAPVKRVTWRNRQTGTEETHPIRNVFLFLGADPATDFLKECGIALDDKSFVKTGNDVAPAEAHGPSRTRMPLETSVPGVFAIGDVRAGSVKRVGAAISEGAAVVAQIHSFIAREAAQAA